MSSPSVEMLALLAGTYCLHRPNCERNYKSHCFPTGAELATNISSLQHCAVLIEGKGSFHWLFLQGPVLQSHSPCGEKASTVLSCGRYLLAWDWSASVILQNECIQ